MEVDVGTPGRELTDEKNVIEAIALHVCLIQFVGKSDLPTTKTGPRAKRFYIKIIQIRLMNIENSFVQIKSSNGG